MLKLCWKDFLASRWIWLLALLTFILYAITPLGWISLAYMLMGAALIYGCLLITAILEDKNRTETLYGSLPLRRSTIVYGRYLLAGFLAVAGGAVVFASIIPQLWIIKSASFRMDPRLMLSIEGVAGFLVVVAALISLYLPFYFGFGLARGSFLFSVALMALSLAMIGLVRFLAGWLGRRGALFRMSFEQDIGGEFIRLIASFRERLGSPAFIGLVLIVLAILILPSLRLSVRFYEKRDL